MAARLIPVVALLLAGLAMLAIAGLQLTAALTAAPGDPVIAALNDDRTVSPAALERLVETRRGALEWSRQPRYHRDYGRASWIIARGHGEDRDQAGPAFRAAVDATEDGLRQAPADPISWLRLAAMRLEYRQDPEGALTALRAAVRAGPYDPFRTDIRVILILRLWPYLTAADRLMFRSQFDHLWNDDPEALVRLAREERDLLIVVTMLENPDSAAALRRARRTLLRQAP